MGLGLVKGTRRARRVSPHRRELKKQFEKNQRDTREQLLEKYKGKVSV